MCHVIHQNSGQGYFIILKLISFIINIIGHLFHPWWCSLLGTGHSHSTELTQFWFMHMHFSLWYIVAWVSHEIYLHTFFREEDKFHINTYDFNQSKTECWRSCWSGHEVVSKMSFSSCLSGNKKFRWPWADHFISLCFVPHLGLGCFSLMMCNMALFKRSFLQEALGTYPCKFLVAL